MASLLYLGLGHLLPLAGGDPESTSATATWEGGQQAYLRDKYSVKYYEFCQNRRGSTLAQGALASRSGGNDGTTAYTATSGTTTTVTGGATLTASKHVGAIISVKDDAGAAGAAPEGDDSIVVSNTTTLITVVSTQPFTAAVAASDVVELIGTWNIEAAAAGDYGYVIKGVVVPSAGIADTYYGWVQTFGICRLVGLTASITLAPGTQVMAGTALTNVTGASSALSLMHGHSMSTISSDNATSKGVIMLACGAYAKSMSTLDATA